MSDSHDSLDPAQDRPETADAPGATLHATVVQYEGRADRCTLYPADVPRHERLCTWLSADHDAFVSLADAR